MKLDSVVLAVHKVESRVDRSAIDGAHDLLATRRPLPSSGALSLIKALFRESRVLALLGDVIAGASLQVRDQVFTYNLLRRKDHGTSEREQRPVSQINAVVRIRMIGRLLDQL